MLRSLSVCRHAVAITPVGSWMRVCRSPESTTAAFPESGAGRLPHENFRGLLSVHSRYGLAARRIANRSFPRRLRQCRHRQCRSDCYRLERPLAGWGSHPLKDRAFARRTRYLIIGTSFYYGSAARDGVAAIWAPKGTGGHRRITRNSRALVQPGEVLLGSCSTTGRVPGRAECDVGRRR